MKKVILLLSAILFCFLFASCSGKTQEENTTHPIEDFENSTSENNEPTFPIYSQFSNCENSIQLPSYDKTDERDGKEDYVSDGKTVCEKTYDENGRIVSVVIYEEDGTTVARQYAFAYENGFTFSCNYYENGEETERFRYNYGPDGTLTSVYRMGLQNETGYSDIECYEFNPDGSVKNYINSDDLSDIMMDVLLAAFSGELAE